MIVKSLFGRVCAEIFVEAGLNFFHAALDVFIHGGNHSGNGFRSSRFIVIIGVGPYNHAGFAISQTDDKVKAGNDIGAIHFPEFIKVAVETKIAAAFPTNNHDRALNVPRSEIREPWHLEGDLTGGENPALQLVQSQFVGTGAVDNTFVHDRDGRLRKVVTSSEALMGACCDAATDGYVSW